MPTEEIIIKLTRDGDNVKTSVTNNAGNNPAMNIMSGAIKLFLADSDMVMNYANLVKTFAESGKLNMEGDKDGE